jgi:Glycosyl hydrolase family 26
MTRPWSRARIARRGLAIGMVCAASAAMLFAAPARSTPASAARSSTTAAQAALAPSLYWGAQIGTQFTGVQAPFDMNAVTKFEALTHKPLSLVAWSSPFTDCSTKPCTFYPFPYKQMETVRDVGAIPVLSWSSEDGSAGSHLQPSYRLNAVTRGVYDSYITSFAEMAKAWGHPFFLRFDWEMNGNWFAWGESVNGNHRGDYVRAWRHVHDIFTRVGATNATWVWCPNVGFNKDYQELYPGNAYVDWTCLDGYNWGLDPHHHSLNEPWKSFDVLFGPYYHQIAHIAPSKPMIIGEIASGEYGGSKAAWIRSALSELPTRYPRIRGLVWLEENQAQDWRIETSRSARTSFARCIGSSAFATNQFAGLAATPIPPPTGTAVRRLAPCS